MMTATIRIHSIDEDGLPDMTDSTSMTGRVAFIWDGCIVSGWPIGVGDDGDGPYSGRWEPSDDRFGGPVTGVTHWIELPVPAWHLGTIGDAAEAHFLLAADGVTREDPEPKENQE